MRLLSRFTTGLCLAALLAATAAAETPSPLRLVPDSADVLVQVKDPRRLVETVTTLDAVKQLKQFPYVKELLDSTDGRRYYQFLAYFEKELGASRLDLLDRLAGGGVVLAGKFGDKAPVLLVIQGKDEKLMKKFVDMALDVIDQELARQEVKERPVKHGLSETWRLIQFGDFRAAVAGPALIVSNNDRRSASRPRSALRQVEEEHGERRLRGGRRRPAAGRPARQPVAQLRRGEADAGSSRTSTRRGATWCKRIVYGAMVDALGRSSFVCAAPLPGQGRPAADRPGCRAAATAWGRSRPSSCRRRASPAAGRRWRRRA